MAVKQKYPLIYECDKCKNPISIREVCDRPGWPQGFYFVQGGHDFHLCWPCFQNFCDDFAIFEKEFIRIYFIKKGRVFQPSPNNKERKLKTENHIQNSCN
jgi:hypothetical protein